MYRHYRIVLDTGSPFVGQYCPVSRQPLQMGQEVVVCPESQTAFAAESWEYLEGRCPFCSVSEVQEVYERVPEVTVQPVESYVPPGPSAWLVLVANGGRSFPLDRDNVSIGRSPDNNVVLADPRVSQYHARIRRQGPAYYLFDLGSTNGTWVNDQPFQRLLLMDGDQIRLGDTVLVFRQMDERRPSVPEGLASPIKGHGLPDKTVLLRPSRQASAFLVVKTGPRPGHAYPLQPEVTTIGRDFQNDIIIEDSAVSRQHAKIRLESDQPGKERFFIYDLATPNGTLVNGEKILKQALEDGDEIEIGQTTLVFKQVGMVEEAPKGKAKLQAG